MQEKYRTGASKLTSASGNTQTETAFATASVHRIAAERFAEGVSSFVPPLAAPRLTVAVCTYDRHDVLPDALASLLAQDCVPGFLEIIVIDNSPDQKAAARVAARYGDEPRIRYLLEPTPGLSNARNVGTAQAKAALVAFVDDDAIVAPNWAREIVLAFDRYMEIVLGWSVVASSRGG